MIIIALLLAILTLCVVWSTFLEALKERREAPGWRRVDGIVIATSFVEEPRRNEKGFYIDLGAEVRYSYEVDGIRYEGVHRFIESGQRGARKISRAMLHYYRSGTRIRLHFDPERPGDAKLLPRDLNIGTQIGCIVVLLLLTIGSYIVAWM